VNRVVASLCTGPAHVVYELVKLQTLRQHWDGPTVVHCSQDDTAALLDPACREFDCELRRVELIEVAKKSNQQFSSKVAFFADGTFPGKHCLYLDSDLIICDRLTELFEQAEEYGVCLTQFCEWRTGGNGLIAKRIRKWVEVDPTAEEIAERTIAGNYPSPNGGIVCGRVGAGEFVHWLAWCKRGMQTFINDETALQMLYPIWAERGAATMLEGGTFNCSPKHKPPSLSWSDVVICHGHGDSFVRPNKQGVSHWLPIFNACLRDNVGGCAEWDLFALGNKWIKQNFVMVDGQLELKGDVR